MSWRALKKHLGIDKQTLPEPDSDGEFEPKFTSRSGFQGLQLVADDSASEKELEQERDGESQSEDEQVSEKKTKKKNKNNKKRKNKKKHSVTQEMDEIERSIIEVNKILGPAEQKSSKIHSPILTRRPTVEQDSHVLSIDAINLNPENEMSRRFGPEPVEPDAPRKPKPHNASYRKILNRRGIVVNKMIEYVSGLERTGLSMSVVARPSDSEIHFIFNHDEEYQRKHRYYLSHLRSLEQIIMQNISESGPTLHVESYLRAANVKHIFEEYTLANELIERAISYMQFVAHPWFNLANRKVRLHYNVLENRPFHVALFKYMYLVTTRGAHRTALELSKVLLNLDPSDRLAILIIIDVFALRAREHEWLIKATEYFNNERQAQYLFNLQYSNALAHYHVALKKKGSKKQAELLLRDAVLRTPLVAMKYLEFMSCPPSAAVRDCPLFNKIAETKTPKVMKQLIDMHAKFAYEKWREHEVRPWFLKNLESICEDYALNENTKSLANLYTNERLNMFQAWPVEVARHLVIIKPMAELICDGHVPTVPGVIDDLDPLPPADTVNRYKYDTSSFTPPTGQRNNFFEFLRSMVPMLDVEALVGGEVEPQVHDEVIINNLDNFIRVMDGDFIDSGSESEEFD